jgi:mono/diheme cytochrome c family protein
MISFGSLLVIILSLAPISSAAGANKMGTGVSAERGKYLVTIASCNDCHTPLKMTAQGPQPDMTLLLSGHPASLHMATPPKTDEMWGWVGAMTMTAFSGPWGTSYAANLTPDMETGLGAWSEAAFIGAMRTGQHMGAGRPIMPPMPWMNIGKMTDDDLKSVFAYLKTIPPVKNQVPDAAEPPKGK